MIQINEIEKIHKATGYELFICKKILIQEGTVDKAINYINTHENECLNLLRDRGIMIDYR